ncbi:hypothetical protein [Porphyromonas sp.]|uniref:hypothetical protein n=1 Tax=Porphyromonas sp. TaxID=1924944 RepID=UPI0026DCE8A0|nr:hypothetical protein [Porphyromonas sp.]MDO4771285.1 hypothetical protein [Porphyromonas sp.]
MTEHQRFISQVQIDNAIKSLKKSVGEEHAFRVERGVVQVALLWEEGDGSAKEFEEFCLKHFVSDDTQLRTLYKKLESNFEILNGYLHKIDAGLKIPLHVSGPPTTDIDMIFGAYDPGAHLDADLFANKIAFITMLNFPHYTLSEKSEKGENWTREEWAYARMGDRFTSRVPADLRQELSTALTSNDSYIADYNIIMSNLVDDAGKRFFPQGMKLISHWGLRDELKSNYADPAQGVAKQRMIYEVMKHIIDQSIPAVVINNEEVTWDPYTNKVYKGDEVMLDATREPDTRYAHLLETFNAAKKLDAYSPHYPTQIDRAIELDMEMMLDDVETLFESLLKDPVVKEVAAHISARLGRPLEPFDIWYDGFKARGTMDEQKLTEMTSKKYPNPQALKDDLPYILIKFGWTPARAQQIAALIEVDPSRGAGHAMGAQMRGDAARLRTRISDKGMDYKGYNIAVHEFGHNVEQTLSMNDVDYYMLNGVPNTGFTEALAFLFQAKDLQLLGLQSSPELDQTALDVFWSCYEIMGVSLVDIRVWQWLYAHPNATPAQLREAVLNISKFVWNKYYAGILGGKDEILLGIYSHMLAYPLYLPNYAVGHLINYQIHAYMEGRPFAGEVERMFTAGRLIPNLWMKHAVGAEVSTAPVIEAAKAALENERGR